MLGENARLLRAFAEALDSSRECVMLTSEVIFVLLKKAALLLVSLLPLAGRVINIGVVAPAAASALGLAAGVWTPCFRRILQ